MSSTTKVKFSMGTERSGLNCTTEHPDRLKERFHDVKADLQENADFEVTNAQVLSVLMDLFWLHHEDPKETMVNG